MKQELCIIVEDYGSHIGEYIRKKLKEQGRNIKWVAEEGLGMSRQNFTNNWLPKAELKPSQMAELERVLGEDFFEEFYESNPNLRQYRRAPEVHEATSGESEVKYTSGMRGSGYSITIEIDPLNFNPDHMQPLSDSLRKALEDFRSRIESDEN